MGEKEGMLEVPPQPQGPGGFISAIIDLIGGIILLIGGILLETIVLLMDVLLLMLGVVIELVGGFVMLLFVVLLLPFTGTSPHHTADGSSQQPQQRRH